jgi:poly-beta-1,6-N-acetyl-D-glucosamine synthase
MKWGIPFSINFLFWSLVGLVRYVKERSNNGPKISSGISDKKYRKDVRKVAVLIAAHNEEKTIQKTINSVKRIIPVRNCFVVSDGSKDKTSNIIRKNWCRYLVLDKPHGKARALEKLIERHDVLNRFDYVVFLDADTKINRNYLRKALKVFQDEKIACIAAYAKSRWKNHSKLSLRYFYTSYRLRLYTVLQFFLTYGQTTKALNVIPVVPGFASMYRSVVLKKLRINVPGIIIEDFNLAFQVHKKKLGYIAHYPSIFATAQDPGNLNDYVKQVTRWNIGFFQTVRTYGIWPGLFWVFMGLFMLEVFAASIFFVFLPFLIFFLLFVFIFPPVENTDFSAFTQSVAGEYLTIGGISLGVFVLDYALTLFVAMREKKPLLALYGIGFIFLRIVDAVILVVTSPQALFLKSEGIWVSPRRN